METLIVDAEGKVTIPPAVLHKRGLRPGDAVALIEAAEGFLEAIRKYDLAKK